MILTIRSTDLNTFGSIKMDSLVVSAINPFNFFFKILTQGEVAEKGTHNELMALKGLYHNLVMRQLTGNETENQSKEISTKEDLQPEFTKKEKILPEHNK